MGAKCSKDQIPEELSHLSPPPRKPGWPIVGNIEFAGEKGELFASCGEITTFNILGENIVLVSDPVLCEKVYRMEGRNVDGSTTIPTVKKLFGDDAIQSVVGNAHKRLRNVLIPCFRPSDLLKTGGSMQEICNRWFGSWAVKGTFDANPEVDGLEFELAMSFIGVKYSSLSKKRGETLRNSIEDFTDAILCVPVNLGKYTQFGRGIAARREILAAAKDAISQRTCQGNDTADEEQTQMMQNDLLQRLINARDENGEPLSKDTIVNNMLAFIIAAFDTTCSHMKALLLNLCRNQWVQDKAHAHIREVLGEESEEYKGNAPIPDDMWSKFEYIEQIILETQRYDPPVAVSSTRTAIKDFELGGHVIAKGTSVLMDVISRSRSPKVWNDPDTFDPERFNRSNAEYKHNVSRLGAFGNGMKLCIGKGFAMLELKVIATVLLRDYKIEFCDAKSTPHVKYPINLMLDGPFRVSLTRRQKA